ncbi:hypothetical protein JXA40_07395 [bacterium]|nr:hypothetical protein [candidate division CSSED10-310 bacterium]
MNRFEHRMILWGVFCLLSVGFNTVIAANIRSTTQELFIEEAFQAENVFPLPARHVPDRDLTLAETLPPDKFTDSAKQAIEHAPLWIRNELGDNFARMDADFQNIYADMILNPSDQRFTDELAFCVAEVAAEILQDPVFLPELLEENIYYIYEHDQYLDYVRLADVGQAGVDEDYYTTTYYFVEESGVTTEYELDREIYYWFIVHPKIEDEMVDYIDPDSRDQHADPPVGVFWRDWLFTYTEPIPGSDEDYPILRDQFAGVDVLWKSWDNIDNGAMGVLTQWILDVLDFTSGAERPHQPVRIYKLHVGRCGEHQDFASAASRACLVPCLNTEAVGEDHVWNEFWDRRWIHWEPVNVDFDVPLVYENGWGKKFSGVLDVYGDGYTWDVIDRYSEGTCTINARIEDADGDPIDGAKLNVKRASWVSAWGFAGSDGTTTVRYGDEVACYVRAITDIGMYPEDDFQLLASPTVNGEVYDWTATLSTTLPQIPATPAAAMPDGDYRWTIDYQIGGEVLVGFYQFDKSHKFTRRIPSGNIDFFIVDQTNYDLYTAKEPFEAHQITWRSEDDIMNFSFPYADIWTAVFTAERKLNCKQLLDVEFNLEQYDGENWTVLDSISRSLELFPGENYRVTTQVPESMGVSMEMPSHSFRPGDPCSLTARLSNPGAVMTDIPLFVMLDACGLYFFWPDWTRLPEISWGIVDVPAGISEIVILPEFPWPPGVGSASGLFFYGAMTDPAITQLLGSMGMWEFGWTE